MSNDIRESSYVEPSLEMIQRYIEEARQLRNETIVRGFRRAFARLGHGVQWLGVRLAGAFRPIAGKGERAPRAC